MKLSDAIDLIKDGVEMKGDPQVWADLGAGSGLFSKALANLLPGNSIIYPIDISDVVQEISVPDSRVQIRPLQMDMTTSKLDTPLNGVLMANSLHFIKDKRAIIERWARTLKSAGRIIIVEYDLTQNPWIPFPVSFNHLQNLMNDLGFKQFLKLAEKPSLYNHSMIYSVLVSRLK